MIEDEWDDRDAATKLRDELARVINPEAFADDADEILDDPAQERAWAGLYSSRIATWLEAHDREITRRARQAYALEVGQVLLNLLPPVDPEPTEL